MAKHSTFSWLSFVILLFIAGGVTFLDCSPAFQQLSAPYYREGFACIVAFIGIFSIRLLHDRRPFVNYLLVCIPYLMVTAQFMFSADLPVHDSWKYHFPVFEYVGDALSHQYFLPEWFPVNGGIRLGFFHINFFATLPHRIFGYLLYLIFPVSVVQAYKIQYVAGVLLICFGWWIVLQKFVRSHYAAYFGTLAIMMGGTGITFHQEQVLATMHLLPWFVLSLWKLREDTAYIFPVVVLLGYGLTTHYPHIHLISMGLLIFPMVCLRFNIIQHLYRQQKKNMILLGVLFFLALLPSLYLLNNIEFLASSHRNIQAETYEEYFASNAVGYSSARLKYFYQYILPVFEWPPNPHNPRGYTIDYTSFFVGRMLLLLALIGVLFQLSRTLPVIGLLLLSILLTLGIYSVVPIPKLLYMLHFPFITTFRQWVHFFPMVNVCLSVLGAMGLAAFMRRYVDHPSKKFIRFLVIIPIFFLQIADLALYDKNYLSVLHEETSPVRLDERFFTRESLIPANIFQYKNRSILQHYCADAILETSFLTTDTLSVPDGINTEIEIACKMFFQDKKTTVTNIPSSALQPFASKNYYSEVACRNCVRFDGLVFDLTLPDPALFATPLNYDLGAEAYIDGEKTTVWRISGALSGVLVNAGNHRIRLKIRHDGYLIIVLIQVCLYIFLVVFFVRKWSELKPSIDCALTRRCSY